MSFFDRKQLLLSILEQTKTLRACGATAYYSDGTYNANYYDGNNWIDVVYINIKNRDIAMRREIELIDELINEFELTEKNTDKKIELIKKLELVKEYEKICETNFDSCHPCYNNHELNTNSPYLLTRNRIDELCQILNIEKVLK